jgi:hypothetical protein
MIATVNLSVPDVVDSETERTVTGESYLSLTPLQERLFVKSAVPY